MKFKLGSLSKKISAPPVFKQYVPKEGAETYYREITEPRRSRLWATPAKLTGRKFEGPICGPASHRLRSPSVGLARRIGVFLAAGSWGSILKKSLNIEMRGRLFICGLAAIALVVPLSSTSAAPIQEKGLTKRQIREISALAAETLKASHLPGLVVAVSKGDQIWSAGFGEADLEQAVPVTPKSVFRPASIGKWFTAVAAMRLVEQGKLDLDAPVQRYCPQYPVKPWPVTSRQLLTHMAGIRHNYGQNGEAPATDEDKVALQALIAKERSTQYTRYTDVIAPLDSFKDDPLLFQPGTKTHYSSLGYRVLGCVLQGAAHEPYRQLMRDLVFSPAGMTSTTEDDVKAVVPHRVAGYSLDPDKAFVRADFRDVSENLPAGGYLSTAEDLVRFVLAFRSGKLVKPSTRDLMLGHPTLTDGTPASNPFGTPGYYYGMGVMVDPEDKQPAWFHTGGQSGSSALLFYFPKSETAVALMTNIDGSAIREPLARSIEEIATGRKRSN